MHSPGAKCGFEMRLKIPPNARTAAEYIQTQSPILRESMAGDMGFFKQAEASESAGVGELMPGGLADWMQIHPADQIVKK